ncbi:hypothetical protein [Mesorhizobium hawassense]|uniref:hypothetical protein n=1 Tax=Mesorhizobium hawassense TaxID=1209954 RepID=UPI00142D7567|nr:hypothetical protein [Mesorhizobium hawassense]
MVKNACLLFAPGPAPDGMATGAGYEDLWYVREIILAVPFIYEVSASIVSALRKDFVT